MISETMSRTKVEPVDQWLAKEGYFRKATPRDPNCLFRSISEQIYHTQHYHLKVRKECIEHMEKKRSLFENFIATPFDYYIREMQCFTEYGGLNEIHAMSLRYERDIIVFVGEKQTCENVTKYGFKASNILLCHTEPKQYEPVYPMAFIESAAYCQSIVYEVLYKNLFKMYDVKAVADKMLNNGSDAFRHDKFFQKGNLDIREQLIEDLYKKVKSNTGDEIQSDQNKKVARQVNSNDIGEIQSDWKRTPIPYKVAKALATDHYRNIELDIWHELKREVKSAGWNRFGNSVLQEGGKCLIEISINDLERQEKNNNKTINTISDSNASESGVKTDQKLKQGNLWLQGYIQKMSTNKEPVLVFIQDLGERKYVPYDALKPLPRKPKQQKNWFPMNRNHSVAPDLNRRWKKYNLFPRKKKPNDNKIAYINTINIDNNDANNASKSSFDSEEHIGELPEDHQTTQLNSNNSIEECSTHMELTTNEHISSSPTEVILNSQLTLSNTVEKKVLEEHKKRSNNSLRNKIEKSGNNNGFGKSFKNTNTKTKALEANHCLSYDNVQIPMNGNPNVPYVAPDGNVYPLYQYVSGKIEENQMDPSFQHAWYKLYPVQMYEEPYRSMNSPYCGPLPYTPAQNGVQSLPAPNIQTNPPYMQDEKHLVNAMQNCSLTCNEGRDTDVENVLPLNINGAQNGARLQNQGPKNANEVAQFPQKGKQTVNNKANRMRTRQNNTRRVYTQFPGQAAIPGTSANTYDTSHRSNMHVMQSPQRYWDQFFPQSPMNTYGSPQYASPNVLSSVPYEYSPQNEGNMRNLPMYYAGNGSYVPHFIPPQHMDENLHYQQVNEGYPPSYSQTGGQPMPYAPPMMYQQLMHYLSSPPLQMQEQWNQMIGTSYVPCTTLSPTLAEPPSNPGPVAL
ncbi:uncharacterized protein LOC109859436 isoform X1 [Pseudomyrmex gracilis]|uniref:uncharacterized protein LOC109859436 isoform X1 n=2 Tax=Pseudomyrmex gracilis TaxID=219809 RepID=UPI0009949182|nr:uncharacterized protein LOC109859436 isoform X1 [Pseudomyrmex gracilis]XP_020293295.1 uncharacterized protein LOC109859436 isoform X1 [Pseudomyrmex gracilis]XP_020293297.1 uncharacterized protein LOC109859436 isoform X1 [Pseudomyrmex gracilis]